MIHRDIYRKDGHHNDINHEIFLLKKYISPSVQPVP